MGNKNSAPQTISIPNLPGKPSSASRQCMFAAVDVQMRAKFAEVSANLQLAMDTISGPSFGGAGWMVKGCYLPTNKAGDRRGQPIEMQQNGLMSGMTRANLFFSHSGVQSLETMFYQTQITLQAGFFSVGVQSFDPLFQAIKMAGESGYTVSCIIDSPDQRISGLLSADTTVTLVCQRPAGIPPSPKNTSHVVVGVPLTIRAGIGSIDCDIPTLASTLDQYGQQGYRLAASYDPPVMSQTGLMSASSVIMLVFEHVGVPQSFCVVDGQCVARAKFMEVSVDHSGYRQIIEGFTSVGWEFAAALDIPKCHTSGLMEARTTLRLIFAAPSSWRQAAIAQPVTVMATPPLDKNADAPPPYEPTL